jgi:uncharacterized membrane protein YdjX (TVP38/TMEM64 family)
MSDTAALLVGGLIGATVTSVCAYYVARWAARRWGE